MFPIIMGTILFLIWILLFQYNRCLMEQDFGIIGMRGATLLNQGESGRDEVMLDEKIIEWIETMYMEKYIGWEFGEMKLTAQGNVFEVLVGGEMEFPVPGWNFWNKENEWRATAAYFYENIAPVNFIRMWNGVMRLVK